MRDLHKTATPFSYQQLIPTLGILRWSCPNKDPRITPFHVIRAELMKIMIILLAHSGYSPKQVSNLPEEGIEIWIYPIKLKPTK